MTELETLKFELKEKQRELEGLKLETFTYNPRIRELVEDIVILTGKIEKMEEKNG